VCSHFFHGPLLPNVNINTTLIIIICTDRVNISYLRFYFFFNFLPFSQVFEVYDSLPEPSLKTMDRVVSSAIDLCTFIYLSVGIAGYLAFADTNFTGILFFILAKKAV
jgi:tryptophan-rich sensory protein